MLSCCRRFLRKSNAYSLLLENNRNPTLSYLLSSVKPWWDLCRYSSKAEKHATKSINFFASSHGQWFLPPEVTRRNEKLRRDVEGICHVLHSRGPQALENALAQLGVRLTEECIVKVLKKLGNDDVLSGLMFFDWAARQRNYRHTTAAYCGFFKMLCQSKSNNLMLVWLDSFQKQLNVRGYQFYEVLIMGYAFAGQSHMALQMFGRMRFQGLDLERVGYDALLNRLIEEKCFDVVNAICKQISISRRHFKSSCSTECIMMRNLCKQGKLEEANELLCKIRNDGSAVAIFVTALCKAKRIDEAQTLIDEIRKEGRVSSMSKVYNAWIKGLVEEEKVDDAVECFEEARSFQGFVPGESCYNALVSGLLKKNRLEKVYDVNKNRLGKVYILMNEMKRQLIFPDNCTMNELICFLCQRRGMSDIVLGLCNGLSKMGFSLGNVTYNALISALCRAGKLDEAHRVLQNDIATGFNIRKQTYFDIVISLNKTRKMDVMQQVIDTGIKRLNAPNVSMSSTFISILCNTGKIDDKFLVPKKMRRKDILLNRKTYSALIQSFYVTKNSDMAVKLLLEMQEYGHHPSRYIFRSVIKVLCETGHSDQVLQLLDMHVSGKVELAFRYWEEMYDKGLIPKLECCEDLIHVLCKVGMFTGALKTFADMREKGGRSSTYIYNILLQYSFKVREIDWARVIFQLLYTQGSHPIASMFIGGLSNSSNLVSILQEIIEEIFVPNVFTFNMLIGALCKEGKVEAACDLFNYMPQKGCTPNAWSYDFIVHGLYMIQRVKEAEAFMKEMIEKGFRPSVWTDNLYRAMINKGK
ncbi:pentatricopeptide repeat-containing protein At1g71210, mitochondrial isoform X2 [Cryptomeria japonica]|uniref:pentatricopeptide repeat-containing protein At1g71210, mitochondrial isoform X2 n=1 Tax=Cryptomeria japonica TaxID=3369 RepID=UPI0027DA1B4F|nr:pentatricopeptide repeat-containing protein At1g71210, mitochondrial isoform X2 [Cryptomeria japonica]